MASAYLLYIDSADSDGSNGSAPRLLLIRTGYLLSNYFTRDIYVSDSNDGFSIKYNNGNYTVNMNNKQFIRIGVLRLISVI